MLAPENKSPCPGCTECNGLGYVMTDDATQKECRRVYYRRLGSRLGAEIATAQVITESPLYVQAKETGGPPEVDKTAKNVFLKGWWGDLLPHFKWAFICKFGDVKLENFYFHTVTDERCKEVWLSKEAYAARNRKKREEVETFNNLAELVGTSYQLVIIRLGFLGHKNVAMPGILKEAMMIRQAANLPTWLVEEPNSPFEHGHFTWSLEVADYIKQRFEVINLVKDREGYFEPRGTEGSSALASVEPEDGMALEKENDAPIRQVISRPKKDFEATPIFDDPLLNGDPKKKFAKKKGGGGSF